MRWAVQHAEWRLDALRKLEALEKSLKDNTKIVIPTGSDLINVIGDMASILPVKLPSHEPGAKAS